MSKLVNDLKVDKIIDKKFGTKDFAKDGKFGIKKGNKIVVPKAKAVVTHSS